jgi:hypothetical protein
MPQLFGPGRTIAQAWNEGSGARKHGGIGAIFRIRPCGRVGVRFPASTCHFGVPRYPAPLCDFLIRPIETGKGSRSLFIFTTKAA